MSSRKCIYTGKDAKTSDKVIPKEGGDEVHNWANTVPCSNQYKKIKGRRQPTETELECAEIFYKLESAKLKVQIYEIKLKELQDKILKTLPEENLGRNKAKKKEKEIKIAYKEKEIKEVDLDKAINKRKLEW